MTESIAIIPARGGSKGIPQKNLRLLAGRPLIAHSIEQAMKARSVNRVAVSTDDGEIAEVARSFGAEVIRRPAEISGDTATSEAALLHALDHLRTAQRYEPDVLVFLQCTSPLTLAEDIDGTVGTMLRDKADTALAVAPFHYFLWTQGEDGQAVAVNHDKRARLLRQQRIPQYRETGSVYAMTAEGFREAKHRFFGRTALYVVPSERCLEIDEPADLRLAEAMLALQGSCGWRVDSRGSVKALILDFDGVFTDNRVIVSEDGTEAVICDRGDGWGLAQLKRAGLPVLVISAERNAVVQARCAKVGVDCLSDVSDKEAVLERWLRDNNIERQFAAYVGNDINDLTCLRIVGWPIAVSDAHPRVRAAARIVLSKAGGHGAIREVCALLMTNMKDREDV